MTEQTNADQLADLFTSFAVGMNPTGLSVGIDSAYELGDHIASTWLAEHDAKVRAEALRGYSKKLAQEQMDTYGIVLPEVHEIIDGMDEEER